MAALLHVDQTAEQIQLSIEYAPAPSFLSGTPQTASPAVLEAVLAEGREMKETRTATARRVATRLGIRLKDNRVGIFP